MTVDKKPKSIPNCKSAVHYFVNGEKILKKTLNYNIDGVRYKDVVPMYQYDTVRSADSYNVLIDQFDVENNDRYKIEELEDGKKLTWCNIYVSDVMGACGVPFTHWVSSDGKPISYETAQNTKGAYECTVWLHQIWLNEYGIKEYGWKKIDAAEAQKRANQGYPTIVLNTIGSHIAVVRPETDDLRYNGKNVIISQAGAYNLRYSTPEICFGTDDLIYYTHD